MKHLKESTSGRVTEEGDVADRVSGEEAVGNAVREGVGSQVTEDFMVLQREELMGVTAGFELRRDII